MPSGTGIGSANAAEFTASTAGKKAAKTPSGGGLSVPAFDPSRFSGAGADTGVRRLTPSDIRTMTANQAAQQGAGLIGVNRLTPAELANMGFNTQAQLAAGLAGPFTAEARMSGYASTIAGLYGANYPLAARWVGLASKANWDQTTFERWLRARPEFSHTSIGQKARADAMLVVAQVFGAV